MPTENSLLRILHYISLFIVIELAMWYSACMKSACSHHPLLSFRSPPVSSKALPQKIFLADTTKLSLDAAVLSAYVCINFCSASTCAKCAATPPHFALAQTGRRGAWTPLASFSGVEEGEEEEHLVDTACACAELPRNSMAAVLIHVCMQTDDVIK